MSKLKIQLNLGVILDKSGLSVIKSHYEELVNQYSELVLVEGNGNSWKVKGVLHFNASYESETIMDNFEIELSIPDPDNYPEIPPIALEIGGSIPKDYHTNEDGSLCLGARLDVRMKFAERPSLLGFVEDIVIPYLFSFCYWKKYGKMPFDELSHGGEGIIEFYLRFFKVSSDISAVKLLKILAEKNYRGHIVCPCSSGLRVRSCHGKLLLDASTIQSQKDFIYDYIHCIAFLKKSGQDMPGSLINNKMINRFQKKLK